jgi:hypothetical protein
LTEEDGEIFEKLTEKIEIQFKIENFVFQTTIRYENIFFEFFQIFPIPFAKLDLNGHNRP